MEISPFFACSVDMHFFGWVEAFDERGRGDFRSLHEYIVRWLADYNAADVTGGDHANFLMAVLVIMHEYEEDPSRLDYRGDDGSHRERRVERLIDLNHGLASYLEQYRFKQTVFHQLSGHEPVS